ncbi:MAG: hypothetical protein WCP85_05240 [Mariniphaga sp.]
MTNSTINFKQERDFGDLFNATFSFISQEFKRLGTAILYFVFPFFIVSAIAMTIYSVKMQEMSQAIIQGDKSDPFAIFSILGSMMGYVAATMLISILATSVLMCTVYGYIKLYIQKGPEGFTINDVWLEVTKYFWKALIATIIVGIVVLVVIIFCVIPGIYLGVALFIVFPIMIFEEKSFGTSFSRSMKLINTNWWLTFGILIVTGIIIYVLAIFVSIPSVILGFKSLFTNIKQNQMPVIDFSIGFYILSAITNLINNLFIVIPLVMSAFIYFSYVEKVEKPSLMDKIGQIRENE